MITKNIKGVFMLVVCVVLFGCTHKSGVPIAENEYYVCSMDPQVMEKQPGPCPICKMPLTKAVIDKSQMHLIKISDEQAQLANIKTEEVKVSTIGKETLLTGVFSINQNKTEQISARIKGRIDQLYYKIIGTQIRKGSKLYDLYSPELLQAQEEYLLAFEKVKLLTNSGYNIVAAAKNRLVLLGMGEAQIKELERTKQAKITTTIYSSVSGVLTDIPLKEGDYVSEGTEVYKVADLTSLWVEAQLYPNELGYLHEGGKVTVVPESFPNERIEGKVVFANPEYQEKSQVNLIRIEINNDDMLYKPGMQVYVSLKSDEKEAIVIPVDAVIQNANSQIAWIQTQKGTFEPREIRIGIQNKDNVEVLSGLKQGERVVVSGAYLLNSEFIFKRGTNPMESMDHNTKM